MRADQQFPLVLIEGEKLIVVRMALLMTGQILLDVSVDGESTTRNQLVKREWVLRVVDLALEHGVEVFEINCRVFDERLGAFAHEYDFDAMIELVQQDIDDFKDEVRLDWHQDLSIEV